MMRTDVNLWSRLWRWKSLNEPLNSDKLCYWCWSRRCLYFGTVYIGLKFRKVWMLFGYTSSWAHVFKDNISALLRKDSSCRTPHPNLKVLLLVPRTCGMSALNAPRPRATYVRHRWIRPMVIHSRLMLNRRETWPSHLVEELSTLNHC